MRTIVISLVATLALFALPSAKAQDCGNWTNWDLRGTYAVSGSGWTDMAILIPGSPKERIPVSYVGAVVYDGTGHGSGWLAFNGGGIPMDIEMKITYQVKPNCSVLTSYTMSVTAMGIHDAGPFPEIMVIGSKEAGLVLQGMHLGLGPGSGVDSFTARRISMPYDH